MAGTTSGYLPVSSNWWLSNASVDLKFTTGQYYDGGDGASVTSLLSISRASVGYARNTDGSLSQFAAGQLRITGLGLLVEDTMTNEVYPSHLQTGWTEDAVTRTVDAIASPYVSELACKLIGSASAGTHRLWQASSLASGVGTGSFFAKAAEYNYAVISTYRGGQYESAIFDLTTGAMTDDNILTDFTPHPAEYSGNGWWRLSATTTAGTTLSLAITPHPTSTSTFSGTTSLPSYTGDGTSGIYVWGGQVEASDFASSYIATTGGTAVRAHDSIQFTGNPNTILNALPNSVVVDLQVANIYTPGGRIVSYSDSGSSSMLVMTGSSTVLSNGITATIGSSLTYATGAKVGTANATSDHALVGGGGTLVNDAFPATTTPQACLGGDGVATKVKHMFVRRVTIWNTRLSDSALQLVTYT